MDNMGEEELKKALMVSSYGGVVKTSSTVNVPITENDLEDVFKAIVYNNDSFEWTFVDEHGRDIHINFMTEDELEQRSN